jgi:hypothetical protein
MPLDRRANSAFIYNCGHSANIVRPTQQSMRQTHDHFGHVINFSVRDTIHATSMKANLVSALSRLCLLNKL